MNDIIKIKNEDGTIVDMHLITVITLTKYNSCYLVFTKEDIKDYNEVYFAKVGKNNELINIESDEEIEDLKKEYMKELSA